MQNNKPASGYRQEFSRDYALMVAKTLVFTIEDMNILGIEDMNERLEDCLYDLMQRYKITKKEIKVRENLAIN